jgi:hypothetical protein
MNHLAHATLPDWRAIKDALVDHTERLAEVERVVTRLRGALAPLLRLLRFLGRLG